jgi:DNA helicase-2/ATP-dependent DNA helicase PcrA
VIGCIRNQDLPLSKPVIRHGEKVRVFKKDSDDEIAADINHRIRELKKNNFKSIAVICKTMDDCTAMLSRLKKGKDGPYIITGSEKEYKGGVVIVPSYLAKGLEFDAVMISDASMYSSSELDAKLLYVAMTRPLHKLLIYYSGEICSLLK